MIFPEVVVSVYAERHGLSIVEEKCPNCNELFPLDVPVAIKGYRGLGMQIHGCDFLKTPRLCVPVKSCLIEKWRRSVDKIR